MREAWHADRRLDPADGDPLGRRVVPRSGRRTSCVGAAGRDDARHHSLRTGDDRLVRVTRRDIRNARQLAHRRRPGPRLHRRDRRSSDLRDHADPDQERPDAAGFPDPDLGRGAGRGRPRRPDLGGRPRNDLAHRRRAPLDRYLGRGSSTIPRLRSAIRGCERSADRCGCWRGVPRPARARQPRARQPRVRQPRARRPRARQSQGGSVVSNSLDSYLILSGLLFAIGTFGFLARRNAISMLMSIELMLNAANLTVLAFGAFVAPLKTHAAVIALLVIAVAAAEATVGLAIVIAIFRNKKTPLVDEYDTMRD